MPCVCEDGMDALNAWEGQRATFRTLSMDLESNPGGQTWLSSTFTPAQPPHQPSTLITKIGLESIVIIELPETLLEICCYFKNDFFYFVI